MKKFIKVSLVLILIFLFLTMGLLFTNIIGKGYFLYKKSTSQISLDAKISRNT